MVVFWGPNKLIWGKKPLFPVQGECDPVRLHYKV